MKKYIALLEVVDTPLAVAPRKGQSRRGLSEGVGEVVDIVAVAFFAFEAGVFGEGVELLRRRAVYGRAVYLVAG